MTCPRCAGCFAGDDLCAWCTSDITTEAEMGVTIPADLWPIEGLPRFRADVAILSGLGLAPITEDDA